MKEDFHFWTDNFFSEFRCYRRWRGGQWRRTHVDHPVCSTLWLKVPDDAASDYSEPLWRGTPEIEDYTVMSFKQFSSDQKAGADYFLRKTGVGEEYREKIERILTREKENAE
jgi:hypothetical protein